MTAIAALWPLAAAGTPLLMFLAIAAVTHFQHDDTENRTEEDDWDMWTEELTAGIECDDCEHQLAVHGAEGCDHEYANADGHVVDYCDCRRTAVDILAAR